MNFSTFLKLAVLLLCVSCSPKPLVYTDHVQPVAISSAKSVTTRVSAVIEGWRNSGVIVKAGESYHFSATGRWRTYGACNFTGPDGIGLYNSYCMKTSIFPEIVNGYSHSTLIARIGEQGVPFAVGAEYQYTVKENGVLMFRINDTINTNFDNEGFVDVKIDLINSDSIHDSGQLAQQELNNNSTLFSGQNKSQIRTALVIGNSEYQHGPLKNPVNDAQAIAIQLELTGFDVTLKLNANQQQMEAAIDHFGRKLNTGEQIALFYYAGHGVQVDGENYLIPTDANIKRQSDVRYKAVNIGQVLGSMTEAKDNLNIVILDACRDNPLPRSYRSANRGLARIEGPKGTILGFATSPGSVASDGDGENGIYTKHLLNNMQKPGLTIEQVFKEVLRGVNQETNGQQIPWTESSFTGDFSFVPE